MRSSSLGAVTLIGNVQPTTPWHIEGAHRKPLSDPAGRNGCKARAGLETDNADANSVIWGRLCAWGSNRHAHPESPAPPCFAWFPPPAVREDKGRSCNILHPCTAGKR